MNNRSILPGAKAGCFVCVTDRAQAKKFYGDTLGRAQLDTSTISIGPELVPVVEVTGFYESVEMR